MGFSNFWRGEPGRERQDRERERYSGRERGEQRWYGGQQERGGHERYARQERDEDIGRRESWRDEFGYGGRYGEHAGGGDYDEDRFRERDDDTQRRYTGSREDWRESGRGYQGSYGGRGYGGSQRSFNDEWEDAYGRGQYPGSGMYGSGGGSYGSGYGGYYSSERQGYGSAPWRDERTGYGFSQSRPATGQFRGRGPRGYRRSDDRIREDVCECLTDDDQVDASNIEVTVKECEVTLAGTVNSREEKRRAEDLSERVSGVKDVSNNLRVVYERSQAEGLTTQGRQSTPGQQGSKH